MSKGFIEKLRILAIPAVLELPLLLLWLLAMSIGGVSDIERLCNIEHLTLIYTRGLLLLIASGICVSALVAYTVAAIAHLLHSLLFRTMTASVAAFMVTSVCFLRVNYGTRLSPEIASVIAYTNRSEVIEYLATYIPTWTGMLAVTGGGVAVFYFIDRWWQCHRHDIKSWHGVSVAICLLLSLVGGGRMVLSLPTFDGLMHRHNSRFDNFGMDALSNLVLCGYQLRQVDSQVQRAITSSTNANATLPVSADSMSIVVVIGESYIKSHASIYGYALPTTPNLSREQAEGRLVAFTDMVAPYQYTNMAMQSILSTNNEADGQSWYDSPLFPALFKRAGFHVDFWDNQREFMQEYFGTRYLNSFLYHPQIIDLCYSRVNNKNFAYDAELIKDYARQVSWSGPELVIFHLRGQHIRADRRYPDEPQYRVFKPQNYHRDEDFINAKRLNDIAHYDNATRYNDKVISMIFNYFSNKKAVVVYVSDHGDEVYDYRGSIGRRNCTEHPDLMIRYQHEVPFMMWFSPSFVARYPEVVSRTRTAADRPATTDNLSQMLLGLSGIVTNTYRTDLDLLSPSYVCPKRTVRLKYDYDQLVGK